ncbi:hypothetical protein AGMMS49949_03570 [Alphaproteobacteria bacterium]|nr:hypothetical protein AGMMS49949_03570 [Alphaproteobacteria bacterium]
MTKLRCFIVFLSFILSLSFEGSSLFSVIGRPFDSPADPSSTLWAALNHYSAQVSEGADATKKLWGEKTDTAPETFLGRVNILMDLISRVSRLYPALQQAKREALETDLQASLQALKQSLEEDPSLGDWFSKDEEALFGKISKIEKRLFADFPDPFLHLFPELLPFTDPEFYEIFLNTNFFRFSADPPEGFVLAQGETEARREELKSVIFKNLSAAGVRIGLGKLTDAPNSARQAPLFAQVKAMKDAGTLSDPIFKEIVRDLNLFVRKDFSEMGQTEEENQKWLDFQKFSHAYFEGDTPGLLDLLQNGPLTSPYDLNGSTDTSFFTVCQQIFFDFFSEKEKWEKIKGVLGQPFDPKEKNSLFGKLVKIRQKISETSISNASLTALYEKDLLGNYNAGYALSDHPFSLFQQLWEIQDLLENLGADVLPCTSNAFLQALGISGDTKENSLWGVLQSLEENIAAPDSAKAFEIFSRLSAGSEDFSLLSLKKLLIQESYQVLVPEIVYVSGCALPALFESADTLEDAPKTAAIKTALREDLLEKIQTAPHASFFQQMTRWLKMLPDTPENQEFRSRIGDFKTVQKFPLSLLSRLSEIAQYLRDPTHLLAINFQKYYSSLFYHISSFQHGLYEIDNRLIQKGRVLQRDFDIASVVGGPLSSDRSLFGVLNDILTFHDKESDFFEALDSILSVAAHINTLQPENDFYDPDLPEDVLDVPSSIGSTYQPYNMKLNTLMNLSGFLRSELPLLFRSFPDEKVAGYLLSTQKIQDLTQQIRATSDFDDVLRSCGAPADGADQQTLWGVLNDLFSHILQDIAFFVTVPEALDSELDFYESKKRGGYSAKAELIQEFFKYARRNYVRLNLKGFVQNLFKITPPLAVDNNFNFLKATNPSSTFPSNFYQKYLVYENKEQGFPFADLLKELDTALYELVVSPLMRLLVSTDTENTLSVSYQLTQLLESIPSDDSSFRFLHALLGTPQDVFTDKTLPITVFALLNEISHMVGSPSQVLSLAKELSKRSLQNSWYAFLVKTLGSPYDSLNVRRSTFFSVFNQLKKALESMESLHFVEIQNVLGSPSVDAPFQRNVFSILEHLLRALFPIHSKVLLTPSYAPPEDTEALSNDLARLKRSFFLLDEKKESSAQSVSHILEMLAKIQRKFGYDGIYDSETLKLLLASLEDVQAALREYFLLESPTEEDLVGVLNTCETLINSFFPQKSCEGCGSLIEFLAEFRKEFQNISKNLASWDDEMRQTFLVTGDLSPVCKVLSTLNSALEPLTHTRWHGFKNCFIKIHSSEMQEVKTQGKNLLLAIKGLLGESFQEDSTPLDALEDRSCNQLLTQVQGFIEDLQHFCAVYMFPQSSYLLSHVNRGLAFSEIQELFSLFQQNLLKMCQCHRCPTCIREESTLEDLEKALGNLAGRLKSSQEFLQKTGSSGIAFLVNEISRTFQGIRLFLKIDMAGAQLYDVLQRESFQGFVENLKDKNESITALLKTFWTTLTEDSESVDGGYQALAQIKETLGTMIPDFKNIFVALNPGSEVSDVVSFLPLFEYNDESLLFSLEDLVKGLNDLRSYWHLFKSHVQKIKMSGEKHKGIIGIWDALRDSYSALQGETLKIQEALPTSILWGVLAPATQKRVLLYSKNFQNILSAPLDAPSGTSIRESFEALTTHFRAVCPTLFLKNLGSVAQHFAQLAQSFNRLPYENLFENKAFGHVFLPKWTLFLKDVAGTLGNLSSQAAQTLREDSSEDAVCLHVSPLTFLQNLEERFLEQNQDLETLLKTVSLSLDTPLETVPVDIPAPDEKLNFFESYFLEGFGKIQTWFVNLKGENKKLADCDPKLYTGFLDLKKAYEDLSAPLEKTLQILGGQVCLYHSATSFDLEAWDLAARRLILGQIIEPLNQDIPCVSEVDALLKVFKTHLASLVPFSASFAEQASLLPKESLIYCGDQTKILAQQMVGMEKILKTRPYGSACIRDFKPNLAAMNEALSALASKLPQVPESPLSEEEEQDEEPVKPLLSPLTGIQAVLTDLHDNLSDGIARFTPTNETAEIAQTFYQMSDSLYTFSVAFRGFLDNLPPSKVRFFCLSDISPLQLALRNTSVTLSDIHDDVQRLYELIQAHLSDEDQPYFSLPADFNNNNNQVNQQIADINFFQNNGMAQGGRPFSSEKMGLSVEGGPSE